MALKLHWRLEPLYRQMPLHSPYLTRSKTTTEGQAFSLNIINEHILSRAVYENHVRSTNNPLPLMKVVIYTIMLCLYMLQILILLYKLLIKSVYMLRSR